MQYLLGIACTGILQSYCGILCGKIVLPKAIDAQGFRYCNNYFARQAMFARPRAKLTLSTESTLMMMKTPVAIRTWESQTFAWEVASLIMH